MDIKTIDIMLKDLEKTIVSIGSFGDAKLIQDYINKWEKIRETEISRSEEKQ